MRGPQPSVQAAASFSRDGRSVYFSSDRSGSSQIWKMPASGGPAIQVTRGEASTPRSRWDARFVYYSNDTNGGEIWRVPVERGEDTLVVRGINLLRGWDLSPTGIYYASSREREKEYAVRFFDLESGRTETLFRREGPFWHWSLWASPDESWITYGEVPRPQSEPTLVENFR